MQPYVHIHQVAAVFLVGDAKLETEFRDYAAQSVGVTITVWASAGAKPLKTR